MPSPNPIKWPLCPFFACLSTHLVSFIFLVRSLNTAFTPAFTHDYLSKSCFIYATLLASLSPRTIVHNHYFRNYVSLSPPAIGRIPGPRFDFIFHTTLPNQAKPSITPASFNSSDTAPWGVLRLLTTPSLASFGPLCTALSQL